MLTMLIGGPGDGEFYELNHNVPIRYDDREDGKLIVYQLRTIGFPDRWRVDVFVHPDVNLDGFTEEHFIDIAMKLWRETHRRKAVPDDLEHVD